MVERNEQILDQCISLMLQGATVDDCLKRYPEYAATLEPQLRVVAEVVGAGGFEPSAEAKARSRRRLEAERRQMAVEAWQRGATATRRSWFGSAFLQVSPRWVAVAAALAVVLFGGGIGTFSASANSLPGEPLYPVKRFAEEARVTLARSDERKADLELAHARKRAQEALALFEKDRPERAVSVERELKGHFSQAAVQVSALGNAPAGDRASLKLQRNASIVLEVLQELARSGPEPMRDHAQALYDEISAHLADVAESLPTPEPTPSPTPGEPTGDPSNRSAVDPPQGPTGTVQLVATNSVTFDADQVLLTVDRIDVQRSGGGGWQRVLNQSRTFNLLRLTEVENLLGEIKLEPGWYPKLRFRIASVEVVRDDDIIPTKVQNLTIPVSRPFTVESGMTTILQLEFNAARLLDDADKGRLKALVRPYALDPVLDLDQPGDKRDKEKEDREDREKDSSGRGSGEDSEKTTRVQIEGIVEDVKDNVVMINGRRHEVEVRAEMRDRLRAGALVRIEVERNRRGEFGKGRILRILEPARIQTDVRPPVAPPTPPRKQPTAEPPRRPGPPPQQDDDGRDDEREEQRVRLGGTIQAMRQNVLLVDGTLVTIARGTRVDGKLVAGAVVRIEGRVQPNGSIEAERVEVREAPPMPRQRPTPTPFPAPAPTPTPTPTPMPTPTPGAPDAPPPDQDSSESSLNQA